MIGAAKRLTRSKILMAIAGCIKISVMLAGDNHNKPCSPVMVFNKLYLLSMIILSEYNL